MNYRVLGLSVLFGFTDGCILFLVSIGLSLCFGLMRIISLDQCGYYALGAYITYNFSLLTGNFWIALIISSMFIAILGLIVEYIIFKNVYAKPLTFTMIISFGTLLLITGIIKYIWGLNPLPVDIPLKGSLFMFGVEISIYRLFVVVITFLIYSLLYFFLEKTIVGKAIRASIEDVEEVQALGINGYQLFTITFVISCVLSGLGGALKAPLIMVQPYMGYEVLLYMFITAVLGGLGSLKGTMLAAIIIGVTMSIGSVVWAPSTIVVPFVAFIVVLLIKPTGLFGSKLLKR